MGGGGEGGNGWGGSSVGDMKCRIATNRAENIWSRVQP